MTDLVEDTDVKLRARPTQARSIATFNAVLDAAGRVLEARGFGALTTNAVAAEAEVTVRAIYRYFPNKHALVAELAQRMSDQWAAALSTPVGADSAPLAERWPDYLRQFVAAVESTPGGRAVLLAMRSDPVLSRVDEAANRRYIADVAAELEAECPELAGPRAVSVATVLLRSTTAVIDEIFAQPAAADRAALLSTLTQMHDALLRDVCGLPRPASEVSP